MLHYSFCRFNIDTLNPLSRLAGLKLYRKLPKSSLDMFRLAKLSYNYMVSKNLCKGSFSNLLTGFGASRYISSTVVGTNSWK